MAKRRSSGRNWKIILFLLILLLAGTGGAAYYTIYKPNVQVETSTDLYIPTGATFQTVLDSLNRKNLLKDERTFRLLAEQKKYDDAVKPGRYVIKPGMNNNALINMLRAGLQTPIRLTFTNARTNAELAGKLARNLEMDSAAMLQAMTDPDQIGKYGLSPETAMTLFIPNTYDIKWNTSPAQLLERMSKEHKKFWTPERVQKAEALNLSPTEVTILASIVHEETNAATDKPIIAGVYLNRLAKDIPLEADPTLRYARMDFSIQRVLNADKLVESKYNTYKYKGLPPGPICLPSAASIDAVLNRMQHEYIFFCAREDLSGYSNFAVTYAEHLANARRYQAALNARGIKR